MRIISISGTQVQDTIMSRLGLAPGLSFFTMKRTIGFDVESIGGTRRFRLAEYVDFLKDVIALEPAEMEAIQVHPIAPYCFVRVPTEERMHEVYNAIKLGVLWPGKGEVMPFLCTESYTEVKVKGVVPGTEPDEVASHFMFYGDVLSCMEFKTKIEGSGGQYGSSTGDYLLKIKLREPIPRLLPFPWTGTVWVCFYEGQEECCWRCFESGHITRSCSNTSDFPGQQREQRRIYFDEKTASEIDKGETTGREPADNDSGVAEQALDLSTVEASIPTVTLIPPSQKAESDVMADEDDDDIFAAGEDASINMALNTQESDFIEAVDNYENKRRASDEKKAAKAKRQQENMARKHLLSANADPPQEGSKKTKTTVTLVSTPLGEKNDQRRGSSENLQPVARSIAITPEMRQKNIANGTMKAGNRPKVKEIIGTSQTPGTSRDVRRTNLTKK